MYMMVEKGRGENMDTFECKFEELAENKAAGFTNPREKFDMNKIKELAADIKERGLMYPLQVWTGPDGEMVVVGGERRRRAIGLLIEEGDWGKTKSIPCVGVQAANLKDAHYAAVADNLHREDLSPYELAKEIYSLKDMGDSQRTISQMLHKSETWISRKLKAFELAIPALRQAWKHGKLPNEAVEAIALMPQEEQEAELEAQLKLRDGTREGKAKAKKRTKGKKLQKPSAKELQGLLVVAEAATKNDHPYVHGVRDALKLAMGAIEEDGLGKEWRQFVKGLEKEAKEAAKEAEVEAKAKTTKKNGTPEVEASA